MKKAYASPAEILADSMLTEDKKIDLTAAWILEEYSAAFEELAK